MKYSNKFNKKEDLLPENIFKEMNLYQNNLTLIDILKKRKLDSCPHCKGNKFIKYGKYKGLQRFRCSNKNCLKTFSQKTNTLFSNSKKSIDLWIKYSILMNKSKTLRECSTILKINLATAFFWRHKILVTQLKNNNNILKNYVELSKIIIKENFKGNRAAKNNEKENIFIACGMDSNGTIISKPISRRTISLSVINKNFSHHIHHYSLISAYNDRYFEIFSNKHNTSLLPSSKSEFNKIINNLTPKDILLYPPLTINKINDRLHYKSIFIHNFSLKIKKWLVRFRGVSTKYLENYLNWHILDFKNNYETFLIDQIKLFKEHSLESFYIKIKDFPKYNSPYKYTFY